ncbi:hypothetical protein P8452_63789 [Trifolium repens]|nr:hypothetical protein P8452_63789 [Trifolium repens]
MQRILKFDEFIHSKFHRKIQNPFLVKPDFSIQINLKYSPPSSISIFFSNSNTLEKISGDQESQNLLIYITDHLNKRGRVLVCGGI